MKFFTREMLSAFSDGDWAAWENAHAAYQTHLANMEGLIPNRVLQLATLKEMQDGLLLRVKRDTAANSLTFVLRCGPIMDEADRHCGDYYDLVLTYKDPELERRDDVALAKVARGTMSAFRHSCDLVYHELDANEDGGLEHRFLFSALQWSHPKDEGWITFTIRCSMLRWKRNYRLTRRFRSCEERYPGGPTDSRKR